ncbi:MAG: alpha/beta hydrolase, partial [Cyanobacteria bacterium P01_H01_bin.130]
GGLDPMGDRDEWLSVGRSLAMPVQLILPEQSPPKSKAEMEALAQLPQMQEQRLPGTLGVHEEYAVEAGKIALAFFQN